METHYNFIQSIQFKYGELNFNTTIIIVGRPTICFIGLLYVTTLTIVLHYSVKVQSVSLHVKLGTTNS